MGKHHSVTSTSVVVRTPDTGRIAKMVFAHDPLRNKYKVEFHPMHGKIAPDVVCIKELQGGLSINTHEGNRITSHVASREWVAVTVPETVDERPRMLAQGQDPATVYQRVALALWR